MGKGGVVVLGAHRPGPRRLGRELAWGTGCSPEPCFSQECGADGRVLRRGCGCGCQHCLSPLQISPRTLQAPTLSSSLLPPPHGAPSAWGLYKPPHGPCWGCPLPPNSAFLHRRTFVWGLDGEQGTIEWLAEDWGHREGQDQERGGFYSATSWTPDDPQHYGEDRGVEL